MDPLSKMSTLDSYSGDLARSKDLRILYKNRAILIQVNGTESGSKEDVLEKTTKKGKQARYLVVSDLHIGFEERFRGAGISLDSRINQMIEELTEIIARYHVTDLLIAGDVKSGTDRIGRAEWENVPKFFERLLTMCRVSVIPGNHDGGLNHLLPSSVELLDVNGALVGKNLIMHGQTRPLAKFSGQSNRLVIGHVHPIYQKKGSPLSGQPVWVFMRTKKEQIFKGILGEDIGRENVHVKENVTGNGVSNDLEIIILPSFNMELIVAGYAADAARQERKIAPILRDLKGVQDAMVATLDGDLIGDETILKNIL